MGLRLLEERAVDDHMPIWSPDGRQIAFVRESEGSSAVYTVAALGGQERKRVDIGGLHSVRYTALAWGPDGDRLVLAEKPSESDPARIVRLSLATLEKRPLTFPPEGPEGDVMLALSPDRSHRDFLRNGPKGAGALWAGSELQW